MTDPVFNFEKTVPDILLAAAKVNAEIGYSTLDRKLMHLVELRASQINGCAYCVKLHLTEARKDGETEDRLDHLVVWRFVEDYDDAERAALAWCEALTRLGSEKDLAPLREELKEHFDAPQIGALTALVAIINLWNRVMSSAH